MSEFKWRHFSGEIILRCVRWYCKYGISYRDLEERMAERDIPVDHTTLYRWVQRYAPELEKRIRWYQDYTSCLKPGAAVAACFAMVGLVVAEPQRGQAASATLPA
jgi:Transposase and inactivated derivatives